MKKVGILKEIIQSFKTKNMVSNVKVGFTDDGEKIVCTDNRLNVTWKFSRVVKLNSTNGSAIFTYTPRGWNVEINLYHGRHDEVKLAMEELSKDIDSITHSVIQKALGYEVRIPQKVKFNVFGHDSKGIGVIVSVMAEHSMNALEEASKLRPDCKFNHANLSK